MNAKSAVHTSLANVIERFKLGPYKVTLERMAGVDTVKVSDDDIFVTLRWSEGREIWLASPSWSNDTLRVDDTLALSIAYARDMIRERADA